MQLRCSHLTPSNRSTTTLSLHHAFQTIFSSQYSNAAFLVVLKTFEPIVLLQTVVLSNSTMDCSCMKTVPSKVFSKLVRFMVFPSPCQLLISGYHISSVVSVSDPLPTIKGVGNMRLKSPKSSFNISIRVDR